MRVQDTGKKLYKFVKFCQKLFSWSGRIKKHIATYIGQSNHKRVRWIECDLLIDLL